MDIDSVLNQSSEICPITGLSIISDPSWENIKLTKSYSATFKLLNEHILISKPIGRVTEEGVKRFFEEREKVLQAVGLNSAFFLELKDYSEVSGTPDKNSRILYSDSILKEENRLIGIIAYNCSIAIKIIGNMARGKYGSKFPVKTIFVSDYKAAIKKGLELIQNHSDTSAVKKNRVIHKNWVYDSHDYHYHIEIINKNILYISIEIKKGRKIKDLNQIEQFFNVVESVLHHMFESNQSQLYFRIFEVSESSGLSHNFRKHFMKRLKIFNNQFPCIVAVTIGSAFLIKIVTYLASFYLPYKIYTFASLDEAIVHIEKHRFKQKLNKELSSDSFIYNSNTPASAKQVNEVLSFLEGIIWDRTGNINVKSIPLDHPLKMIFEAISIVKLDIDELLEERIQKESELSSANKELEDLHSQLRLANEELENRVRQRTQELELTNTKLMESQENVRQLNQQLSEQVIVRTSELKDAQKAIIAKEHKSEMADVTTGTLHNVKNILNSIKVSAGYVAQINSGKALKGFKKANELLSANLDDLKTFISENPKGEKLMRYYIKLSDAFDREVSESDIQLIRLRDKIGVVERIVSTQQEYGSDKDFEETDINRVIEDAVLITTDTVSKNHINVDMRLNRIPRVDTLKNKLLHVLINLIKNSQDALQQNSIDNRNIVLETELIEDQIQIKLIDNGIGIKPDKMKYMFEYGFTTKSDGHGFGLSSSRVYIEEMGGEISVSSEGINKGATFLIQIPIKKEIKDISYQVD